MEPYQWLAGMVGLWCLLYLIDSYSKFNASRRWQMRYQCLVTDNGLSVHLGRCQWYTRRLNPLFSRLGQLNPTLLDWWFDLGVIASLLCGCCSIIFLCMAPINTLFRAQSTDEQILKPVIPGVNLPKKDMGYYLLTLFLSALLHEFGHAIAAVRESVKINGFGMFMFLIYPGAFVDMHSESLFAVTPWKQLRIFCAGIWHNLIIVLAGLVLLFTLPPMLRPFYSLHTHLVIVSHTDTSVVSGESGLFVGDIVTQIDNCKVASVADWRGCLVRSLEFNSSSTYKVSRAVMESHSPPVSLTGDGCRCGDEDNHICFQYNTKPGVKLRANDLRCLRAREVISYDRCSPFSSSDCVTPYIGHLSNATRLLILYRSIKPPVLFFGHPAELHLSVIIGEVVPKYESVPLFLPYALENLFKYFISLSGALAILNIVPCYALDGQYIAKAVIDIVFKNYDDTRRELILTLTILFGTFLLLSNVLLAIYGLLF